MILSLQDGFLSNKSDRKARKKQRQAAKTQRQATRQTRKQSRLNVGVEKQNKRMVRVKGKQEVINARKENKLKNLFFTTPEEQAQPQQAIAPSAPSAASSQSQQSFEPQYDEVEEYYDDEMEMMPEDEESEDGLSAGGFIKTLTNVGKGIAPYLSPYLPSLDSKQVIQMQQEKVVLQQELERTKRNLIIYGIGGTALGAALGYFISKR